MKHLFLLFRGELALERVEVGEGLLALLLVIAGTLLLLAPLLLALFWSGFAAAHGKSVSYSTWEIEGLEARVSVRLKLLELSRIGPEALPPGSVSVAPAAGSPDLPAYVDHLAERLGDVSLVICLDSGAADYDALWVTTSLRGLAGGTLEVRVANVGLHSGSASGIVPSDIGLW